MADPKAFQNRPLGNLAQTGPLRAPMGSTPPRNFPPPSAGRPSRPENLFSRAQHAPLADIAQAAVRRNFVKNDISHLRDLELFTAQYGAQSFTNGSSPHQNLRTLLLRGIMPTDSDMLLKALDKRVELGNPDNLAADIEMLGLYGHTFDTLTDDGVNLLHRAAEKNQTDIIYALYRAGAHLDTMAGGMQAGETALMMAARKGHDTAVQALLRCGARDIPSEVNGDYTAHALIKDTFARINEKSKRFAEGAIIAEENYNEVEISNMLNSLARLRAYGMLRMAGEPPEQEDRENMTVEALLRKYGVEDEQIAKLRMVPCPSIDDPKSWPDVLPRTATATNLHARRTYFQHSQDWVEKKVLRLEDQHAEILAKTEGMKWVLRKSVERSKPGRFFSLKWDGFLPKIVRNERKIFNDPDKNTAEYQKDRIKRFHFAMAYINEHRNKEDIPPNEFIDMPLELNKENDSLLQFAARERREDLLMAALEYNPDLNHTGICGEAPVHIAARNCDTTMLMRLLGSYNPRTGQREPHPEMKGLMADSAAVTRDGLDIFGVIDQEIEKNKNAIRELNDPTCPGAEALRNKIALLTSFKKNLPNIFGLIPPKQDITQQQLFTPEELFVPEKPPELDPTETKMPLASDINLSERATVLMGYVNYLQGRTAENDRDGFNIAMRAMDAKTTGDIAAILADKRDTASLLLLTQHVGTRIEEEIQQGKPVPQREWSELMSSTRNGVEPVLKLAINVSLAHCEDKTMGKTLFDKANAIKEVTAQEAAGYYESMVANAVRVNQMQHGG